MVSLLINLGLLHSDGPLKVPSANPRFCLQEVLLEIALNKKICGHHRFRTIFLASFIFQLDDPIVMRHCYLMESLLLSSLQSNKFLLIVLIEFEFRACSNESKFHQH